jgi:hypothetical protein
MYFQSSAGRPQAYDRILCSELDHFSQNPRQSRLFALWIDSGRCESEVTIVFQVCENRGLSASCLWFAGGEQISVDVHLVLGGRRVELCSTGRPMAAVRTRAVPTCALTGWALAING